MSLGGEPTKLSQRAMVTFVGDTIVQVRSREEKVSIDAISSVGWWKCQEVRRLSSCPATGLINN